VFDAEGVPPVVIAAEGVPDGVGVLVEVEARREKHGIDAGRS
jgi:hypothetical protein